MFARFHQVEPGDRRRGGIGLGLAICKALVEQHGGRIRVAAAEGPGAEFRFTVPAGDGSPPGIPPGG